MRPEGDHRSGRREAGRRPATEIVESRSKKPRFETHQADSIDVRGGMPDADIGDFHVYEEVISAARDYRGWATPRVGSSHSHAVILARVIGELPIRAASTDGPIRCGCPGVALASAINDLPALAISAWGPQPCHLAERNRYQKNLPHADHNAGQSFSQQVRRGSM